MKPKLKILLSALILIAGVGFIFFGGQIDKAVLWNSLKAFGPKCVFAVLGLCVVQLFFMSLRLKALLPRDSGIKLFSIFYAFGYGQFVNTFIPARAGELVKLTLLKAGSTSVQTVAVVGTLVSEKVVDVISLLLMVALSGALALPKVKGLFKLPAIPWRWVAVAAAILVVGFIVSMRSKRFREMLDHLLHGLQGLASPTQLGLGILVSFAAWTAEASALMVAGSFQGVTLPFAMAMFVLAVLNLAIAIPISVANLGTFEASIIFALQRLDVPFNKAIAIATFHHAMQLAGISLMALVTWAFCRRG